MSVTGKKGTQTRYFNDLQREINAQTTRDIDVIQQHANDYNVHEIPVHIEKIDTKLGLLVNQYDKLEAANIDYSAAIEDDEVKTTTFETLLDSEAPIMTKANDFISRFRALKKRLETRQAQLIAEAAARDVLVAQNRDLRERVARQLVVGDPPGPVNANLPNPAGGARAKT